VPFTSEIMQSMAHLADIEEKGAYDNYKGGYDSATKRYHLSDEKPLPGPGGTNGAPEGASAEVYAQDGKTLLGHVVNGAFVKLGAK
jgi:hypothetical protein